MPRPGPQNWATNANHAGAAPPAWAGQPNKVAPTAGKILTGRIPEEPPPAEETNMWRWSLALILASCSSIRTANYSISDTTGINGTGTGIGAQGTALAYDPTTGYFGGLSSGGGGPINREFWADGGLTWSGAAPGGWGGLGVGASGYDIDPAAGLRSAAMNAADKLYYSMAGFPGAGWALWNGIGATGNSYKYPMGDGQGTWVVYNRTGGTLEFTTNPAGVALAVGATQPGFAGGVSDIWHSRHPAGTADQYDTGNQLWMAATATQVSTSTDGSNWTPAVAHGINTPYDIAYSYHSRRWHMLDGQAGNTQHYYSDDDGLTWQTGTVINTPTNAPFLAMATDGYGHLLVTEREFMAPPTTVAVYISLDDGATWERIALPNGWVSTSGTSEIQVAYGGGRFIIVGDNAGGPALYQAAASLMASER